MEIAIASDDCILKVPQEKYEKFCVDLEKRSLQIKDLSIFKNESVCDLIASLCNEIFSDEIKDIISLVNQPNVGIAALDIPEMTNWSSALNGIYSAAIVIGIFKNIGIPNMDPINKMPFTIHTASHENAKRLDAGGLDQYTPEVKLGFHNDGLLSNGKIEIPNHIAIYNLYISYRRPGNFMWIPIALWEEAEKYEEISKRNSINIKIRLTPSYYFDKTGEVKNTVFDFVEAPLSSINKNGDRRFFLNGQVLPEDNPQEHVNLIQALRNSLEKNPKKIFIPQKERRVIFLKNTMGFHARDIFQEPMEEVDLTRVFIRAVDLNTEIYAT